MMKYLMAAPNVKLKTFQTLYRIHCISVFNRLDEPFFFFSVETLYMNYSGQVVDYNFITRLYCFCSDGL